MAQLTRILTLLSYGYILIIAGSAVLSALLPSIGEIESREVACYWTNVMVVYVECGSALFANTAMMLFFNFWTFFFYAPFIAYSEFLPYFTPGLIAAFVSVVLYAPIVFLAWRVLSRWAKKRDIQE